MVDGGMGGWPMIGPSSTNQLLDPISPTLDITTGIEPYLITTVPGIEPYLITTVPGIEPYLITTVPGIEP